MDFSRFIAKALHSDGLIALLPQNQMGGAVSYDLSKYRRHGALTAVTHRQPGVPGLYMPSTGYDGLTSFNNIYSAGFANDNLLSNPGFETAGGGGADIWANWIETAGNGALANEIVIVHQGNDAAKMTAGVSINTLAIQDITVVPDTRYRLRFWTRGDGVREGRYYIYDVTNAASIISTTNTGIAGVVYTPVVKEFTTPAGCTTVRIALRCSGIDAGVCYYDACEVRSMDGFLGDQGAIIIPAMVENAGVWTDGVNRYFARIAVDAGNYIYIRKTNVNNQLRFAYGAGAANETVFLVTGGPLGFVAVGATWDISAGATGEVLFYFAGIQTGVTQVGLGTWLGDLSNADTVIGAQNTGPGGVWSGNIAPTLLYNETKSPAEMAYLMKP